MCLTLWGDLELISVLMAAVQVVSMVKGTAKGPSVTPAMQALLAGPCMSHAGLCMLWQHFGPQQVV